MVIAMPFDFVALVRCFFGRDLASSNANFRTRSTPTRDITVSCMTISRSVPGYMLPRTAVAAHDRGDDVGHQARWAQVDVLVELAAEQQQRAPQRHVVRDLLGPADGAEEQSVMATDLVLPVVRHHLAVLLVVVPAGEV